MHLRAFQAMLPAFAAAHHYARSGQVYLQQMQDLPSTHPWLHKQFQDSIFAIWQSDQLWAGLPPDLVVKQELMIEIEGHGGLTRGRRMTETHSFSARQ